MKIVTLSPAQFDKYASKHRYRNYFQTSAYGKTMQSLGYNIHYFGVVDTSNNLMGASLIIYKKIFMNNKIAYAPRGFLFDYTDSYNVRDLASHLKTLLGKQGFMLLRIDPYITSTIRMNDGNILNINNEESIALQNLKKAKFEYKGENLFFEYEKPRFEALVILNKDPKTLFENFDKRTRTKIRKALTSGIDIIKDTSHDVTDLYNFIKGKDSHPLKYYQSLCENFGEDADLYYARVNAAIYVETSKSAYERELQINEQLAQSIQEYNPDDNERMNLITKKMESDKLLASYKASMLMATDLIKEYPDGITVGAILAINYDNSAHIIAEGVNEKYASINANYLIKWQMINDYYNKGHKFLNLSAIVGEFEKENEYSGLNESKLGFGSTITEYIGEFDIVLNSFNYNMYQNFNGK